MIKKSPTAAVLLIGDELLSGRTRDINLQQIASYLAPLGIPVRETRIVPDVEDEIVEAVNSLRAKYTYVFTTGGIGPTHDDITADAIAKAFGVEISEHPEVTAMLAKRYEEMGTDYTPARRRMARIPHGAQIVANPVSGAPTSPNRWARWPRRCRTWRLAPIPGFGALATMAFTSSPARSRKA